MVRLGSRSPESPNARDPGHPPSVARFTPLGSGPPAEMRENYYESGFFPAKFTQKRGFSGSSIYQSDNSTAFRNRRYVIHSISLILAFEAAPHPQKRHFWGGG